ncbi:MAG: cell division protein FtsA [Candidatus Krumholzibacteria bacterium]|jgi:cell division protein FtsA|nr:cell division protein FtsA [Candidatus Krumholzibacteria bacterium]MDP6669819.1 cell division protein FtsA [Candidatus Krumholzibacteria bacterium]MDP6796482.1 cell division protein FtsA [Candidatus Krumholzibacteria bacterium]MDP7021612.1 cell division protein FtsA [Candidatus Krumholzibacteria bacterium]
MNDSMIIVGLDLGSHRVSMAIAELDGRGKLRVLGLGTSSSEGIVRGEVMDFDRALDCVRTARREAEAAAGHDVQSAFVSVSGKDFVVRRSEGVHVKDGDGREITREDLEQVVRVAKGMLLPEGYRILHTLPVDFILDGRSGIKDPVGMDGIRLQAEVQLVLGSSPHLDNTRKLVEKAGVGVESLVFSPLATAMAALSPDERETGTILFDIGDGSTEILVLEKGALQHCQVLPIGGSNISRDLSIGLSIPFEEAERLKRNACVAIEEKRQNLSFPIRQMGSSENRSVSLETIRSIMDPRLNEILEVAWRSALEGSEAARLPSTGLVLCGGVARMPGIGDLASQRFDRPVRLASPVDTEGLLAELRDPRYTPLVGLLRYGYQRLQGEGRESVPERSGGSPLRRALRAFSRR